MQIDLSLELVAFQQVGVLAFDPVGGILDGCVKREALSTQLVDSEMSCALLFPFLNGAVRSPPSS